MESNVVYINKRAEENAALRNYVAWLDTSNTPDERAARAQLVNQQLQGRGSNGKELMDLVEKLKDEGL